MDDADAKATREYTLFSVLVEYTGQTLTPDRVDELRDRLNAKMETGPCAWAFQQQPPLALARAAVRREALEEAYADASGVRVTSRLSAWCSQRQLV